MAKSAVQLLYGPVLVIYKCCNQVAEFMSESEAELVVLGGDLNTDPRWGEPGLFSLVTSGLANSFHSPETTDMHWFHPDR